MEQKLKEIWDCILECNNKIIKTRDRLGEHKKESELIKIAKSKIGIK